MVSVIPSGEEFTPGSRFTILTANSGLTGKFDSLTHGLVNLGLSYDPTHVYLDVLRFCDMVDTANQCSTGSAAENLGSGNPIYKAIIHLPDQGSVREAFNRLSGEGHASVQGVLIEDSRFIREAVSDRVREAFHSAGAQTRDTPGHILQENAATGRALWGRVLGSFGHRDGGLNADRIGRALAGIFVGGDMLIADKFLVGLAGGYTAGSYEGARLFTGSSDNYHVSLYGGTQLGPLGLRVGSAYIWHDLETGRDVMRSEEHTSELQSPCNLVCRLLLEKKKNTNKTTECSAFYNFKQTETKAPRRNRSSNEQHSHELHDRSSISTP